MARKRPVVRDDGRRFPSVHEAARAIGVSYSSLAYTLSVDGATMNGHSYAYMDESDAGPYAAECRAAAKAAAKEEERRIRREARVDRRMLDKNVPRLKLPGTGPCRSCAKWTPLPGIRGLGDCADGYRSAPTDTCDRYEGRRSR